LLDGDKAFPVLGVKALTGGQLHEIFGLQARRVVQCFGEVPT
jgi:hypothetical protein